MPVLSFEEATALLTGMDVLTVVGLRDRAIIAVMTYTFARVGAVVALTVEDYFFVEETLVAAPPRKKRQAQRNALPPQAGRISRRLHQSRRPLTRPQGAAVSFRDRQDGATLR